MGLIYRDCVDSKTAWDLTDRFVAKVRDHQIPVEGFETIEAKSDQEILLESLSFFARWDYEYGAGGYGAPHLHEGQYGAPIRTKRRVYDSRRNYLGEQQLPPPELDAYVTYLTDYIPDKVGMYCFEYGLSLSAGLEWGRNKDIQELHYLLMNLCTAYYEEFERVAQHKVAVLEWNLDKDTQGDKYTGYLVQYEVGIGHYELISLIEYKESDRYTIKSLYNGKSLKDMNALCEQSKQQ